MKPVTLGILLSGSGTTFLNLHQAIESGQLKARIGLVITNRRRALGLERARELGYPTKLIRRSSFSDDGDFSQAIDEELMAHEVELVVLAGFLKRYIPPIRYSERCINIHPSLIPAFCGQGFYGMRVHEAVWKASSKISGCTVHLVNEHYDEGPIIVQKAVAIHDRDTPEDIRRKVFELECKALPEAINLFADQRIQFEHNRSIITSSSTGEE